jgi:hypothetical protein
MLAFENITRRVQRTMEDSKYLEKQRLVREQTTRTNRKKLEDGTGFGAAMGGSRTSTRSLVPVRPVDKDPSVLGLPIRFCGSNQSGLAKESKTRGRRGRKIGHSGQQKVAVRGDDNGGDEALQNYSPLKYKVVGAAGKQQLELPPIWTVCFGIDLNRLVDSKQKYLRPIGTTTFQASRHNYTWRYMIVLQVVSDTAVMVAPDRRLWQLGATREAAWRRFVAVSAEKSGNHHKLIV